MEEYLIELASDFPMDDYEALVGILHESNAIIPAYIAPSVGLLSLHAVKFASAIEGLETVVLLDRNLLSRLVKVVRDGGVKKWDTPTRIALALMALAQTVNFNIEPALALHEFAHGQGNDLANEELALFRVADHADARQWIELALGRRESFVPGVPVPVTTELDLAFPLHRWRRNYIALLKVAELELSELAPVDRMVGLLEWMRRDFLIAGPAAVFAARYFAPNMERARILKGLKSPNRERSLAGVRNAAWDVTQISILVDRAAKERDGKRYLLASADRALRAITGMVVKLSIQLSEEKDPAKLLGAWWPENQASIIGRLLAANIELAASVEPGSPVSFTPLQLDQMTAAGEEKLRNYSP